MYHHKFALIFAQIYHQEGCSMRNLVRTILAFALLAMLPAVASAQIDVGIRGGLNLSSFGGADADDVDFGFTGTRTAVNIGAFLNVPVSDVFGVQIGGAYSKKGGQETEEGVDITLGLDYAEFSILAKISPPTEGSVGFDLFLGPKRRIQIRL